MPKKKAVPRPTSSQTESQAGESQTAALQTSDLQLGEVAPGTTRYLELPVARLVTGNWMSLPVAVLRGAADGPRLGLLAALHGDELNGMEIIREALQKIDVQSLRGTVVAVPVVNVFGFIQQDRYLPDRRDLNRSFPGSPRGSLASRIAHLFLEKVVHQLDVVLDFHTGSMHRENLPQIRAHLDDPEIRRLAEAFGAPLIFQAPKIRGTLREAAGKQGVRLLLFEGGEPLRFNDDVIDAGIRGTLRVLDALGMQDLDPPDPPGPCFLGHRTSWVRASRSGIFRLQVELGQRVAKGQLLGEISRGFFGNERRRVKAPFQGLVLGFTNNPLVHQGDALLHLAEGEEIPRGEVECRS